MKTKAILLVGGNSEIGNAIARGVSERKGIEKTIKVSRVGQSLRLEDSYEIEKFSSFDIESIARFHQIEAIIVAFGVLESRDNYLEDLKLNLDVNVLEYLKVCVDSLEFVKNNVKTELHVTSSILADFSRESVFAYASSKNLMESSFLHLQRQMKQEKAQVYVWKLAYVDTKLNLYRKKSPMFTTLASIEKAAVKYSQPGIYYLPRIVKFPSKILGHFPSVSMKIQ
jgi:NAD(P)-dependent dehydrogenase (short-subunit alcohol dehydrogenase family)